MPPEDKPQQLALALVIRPEFTVIDGRLVGYIPQGGVAADIPVHLPEGYCFVVRRDPANGKRAILTGEKDWAA